MISEGDYITLNVPYYGQPAVYLGQGRADRAQPRGVGDAGLHQAGHAPRGRLPRAHQRRHPARRALARSFGAAGIGLCRTEHMFFDEKRINVFREMILSDTREERKKALAKLLPIQKTDFYKLLKIMSPHEVTIRLLDAPLHEFLPHNDEEMKKFVAYLAARDKAEALSEKEVRARCEALGRVQPHARSPRLPHRCFLPRNLRDAGAGHLRGGLHPPEGRGGGASGDHDPDHHERERAEAAGLREEDRGRRDPRPGRRGGGDPPGHEGQAGQLPHRHHDRATGGRAAAPGRSPATRSSSPSAPTT